MLFVENRGKFKEENKINPKLTTYRQLTGSILLRSQETFYNNESKTD